MRNPILSKSKKTHILLCGLMSKLDIELNIAAALCSYLTGVGGGDQLVGVTTVASFRDHGGHVAGQQVLVVPHDVVIDLRLGHLLLLGLALNIVEIFENSRLLSICGAIVDLLIVMGNGSGV